MLIITAHHFAVHSGFDFSFATAYQSGTVSIVNLFWIRLIQIGGKIGVDVFVLISGYFLIRQPRLNWKKLFYLWFQIFSYSVGIYALFLFTGATAFSLKDMVKAVFPILSGQWWFASTYFALYLMSPFLNVLLCALPKKDFQHMLLGMFLLWCLIPSFMPFHFQSSNLLWFVCLYSLAAYVRLWGTPFSWDAGKCLCFSAAVTFCTYLSAVVLTLLGNKIPLFARYATHFYGQATVTILAISFFLFLGFKNLKIAYSPVINKLASATFGVYLIHDNNLVRPFFWKTLFRNATFADSRFLIPYSCAVILTVYVFCTAVELLRSYVTKKLFAVMQK